MNTEYLFRTSSDPGRQQVDCLSAMLDDTSRGMITGLGVRPGWCCLELGAGNGSIARWLASRVRPDGRVVAVDVDSTWLDPGPLVAVHQRDVNDGLPDQGPFDLVHARLLLMHLARREQLLDSLTAALAPGGWVMLCDLSGRLPTAVSAADPADAALYNRIMEVGIERVARPGGMNTEWAHSVVGRLVRAGLTDVRSEEYAFTAPGGSPGLQYQRSLMNQMTGPFQQVGITADEIRRFTELMVDPSFVAWSYQFVFTWVVAHRPEKVRPGRASERCWTPASRASTPADDLMRSATAGIADWLP